MKGWAATGLLMRLWLVGWTKIGWSAGWLAQAAQLATDSCGEVWC